MLSLNKGHEVPPDPLFLCDVKHFKGIFPQDPDRQLRYSWENSIRWKMQFKAH